MGRRVVAFAIGLILLRSAFIVGQALRFYQGDLRIPLLVGKTRGQVESILKQPVQEHGSEAGGVCIYDTGNYSVRVRYKDGYATFVENPDYADE